MILSGMPFSQPRAHEPDFRNTLSGDTHEKQLNIRRTNDYETTVHAGLQNVKNMNVPTSPLSELPFPRRPSSEEQQILYRVFNEKVSQMGLVPSEYQRHLDTYIINCAFENWSEVQKGFKKLMGLIRSGQIFYVETGKIKPPTESWTPWKHVDDPRSLQIAITQLATTHIRNARFRATPCSMDVFMKDLQDIKTLHELTQERVVGLLKDAWKKRNDDKDFSIYFVNIQKADMDKFIDGDIEK